MATDSPRVVVGSVVGVVGDETATPTNEDDDAVASIGAMSVKELKAACAAKALGQKYLYVAGKRVYVEVVP